MLPPNAEISVYLEDVSRADAPAIVLSKKVIKPVRKGPPWDFSIEYDPDKIIDRHRYVLRSRIEAEGRLLFINTQSIPAFGERAKRPAEIMLSQVASRGSNPNDGYNNPNITLTANRWKLVEINGKSASLGAGKKELYMTLNAKGNSVYGYSGCNTFTGKYEISGYQLELGPLTVTRRACIEGMEQEQLFLKALDDTRRFAISENNLGLYDGQDNLILRFQVTKVK